jgi:hypothetical protein
MFALKVTLELAAIFLLLYGFYREDDVIAWENKKAAEIKEINLILKQAISKRKRKKKRGGNT